MRIPSLRATLGPLNGGLICALILAGCAAPPPPGPDSLGQAQQTQSLDWLADFGGLRQAAHTKSLQVLRVDAAASKVRIHVFRGGRAARLGHNHVLSVADLQGLVALPTHPALEVQEAGLELAFRLDAMVLDDAEARAALGPGWASALSAEAIAATRRNMLGPAGLQAEQYPQVRLRSLAVRGAAPKLALLLEIELHGQRRQQWLALHAELQADRVQATGAWVLRQSDFGLQAFSVAGGLLAVQDELLIEFDIVARR